MTSYFSNFLNLIFYQVVIRRSTQYSCISIPFNLPFVAIACLSLAFHLELRLRTSLVVVDTVYTTISFHSLQLCYVAYVWVRGSIRLLPSRGGNFLLVESHDMVHVHVIGTENMSV